MALALRWRRSVGLALVLVPVLLPLLLPLLLVGYPRGHDWRLELVRTAQFQAAWAEGQLLPYWAPDLYGGFGSPVLLFYAPLGSALAALGALLSGSVLSGSAVVLALILVIAALGGARLAQVLGAPPWLGAVLVGWQPYLLTNVFLRNAGGEALGIALLGWLIAAMLTLDRDGRWGGLAWGLALTVLAHNLTALVAVVLVVMMALGLRGPRASRWSGFAKAASCAAGATAWFWLPVLWYRDLVRLDELGRGKFDAVANLAQGVPWWAFDGRPAVGWVVLAGLVAGGLVVGFGRDWERRHLALAALMGAGVLIGLLQPWSVAVWSTVPGMSLLQFPWRLLGVLGLLAAVLILVAVAELRSRGSGVVRWVEVLAVIVALAAALIPLGAIRPLSDHDVIEKGLRPEEIRQRLERATVGHEFLPQGAAVEVVGARREPAWRTDGLPLLVEAEPRRGSDVWIRTGLDAPASVELGRWFFPGWAVEVDQLPVPINPSPQGTLAIELPAGQHQVIASVTSPPARKVGLLISAVTLLVVGWRRWNSRPARRVSF